jgi:hypothetical protein
MKAELAIYRHDIHANFQDSILETSEKLDNGMILDMQVFGGI